jgi:hypothetical protein
LPDSQVDIRAHVATGTIVPFPEAYFAVAPGEDRWVWKDNTSGNWTNPDNWTWSGLTRPNAYPQSLEYPAFVDGTGTVVVDTSSGAAARVLHLATEAGATATLQINGVGVSIKGLLIGERCGATGVCTLNAGQIGEAQNIVVRSHELATGTLQGKGQVAGTGGALTNNGKVKADGGVLDLRGLAEVGNTIDNPVDGGHYGWYAINGGELKLPAITIQPDLSCPCNWGEKPYSLDNTGVDLVNSLQITPTEGISGGNLQIALLDAYLDYLATH